MNYEQAVNYDGKRVRINIPASRSEDFRKLSLESSFEDLGIYVVQRKVNHAEAENPYVDFFLNDGKGRVERFENSLVEMVA